MKRIYKVTTKVSGGAETYIYFTTKELADQVAEGMLKYTEEKDSVDFSVRKEIVNVFENEEDLKGDIVSSAVLISKCKEEGLSPEECLEKYNNYTEE